MKQCTKCGETKPTDGFSLRSDTGRYRSACKDCHNKANLDRYYTNETTKEAHRKASRKHSLKKYGLTQEQYDKMYAEQDGRCAICSCEISHTSEDRYLSSCVDHNHKTGKVRGLLCWDCNVGLGKFFDNPEIIRNAISYLQSTR